MTETTVAPRATLSATLIGFGAIVLWSSLALLTALSGAAPPFELAALTFAVGGLGGLAYAAARGRLSALAQPWPFGLSGSAACSATTRSISLRFAALRPPTPA